ncbi:MAG: hypothetical protein ACN4G0_10365 [Polyangiales bacterium]
MSIQGGRPRLAQRVQCVRAQVFFFGWRLSVGSWGAQDDPLGLIAKPPRAVRPGGRHKKTSRLAGPTQHEARRASATVNRLDAGSINVAPKLRYLWAGGRAARPLRHDPEPERSRKGDQYQCFVSALCSKRKAQKTGLWLVNA